MDFTGLSAFPPTPLTCDSVDEAAFRGVIERLATTGVDSIGALGSTGHYAYLSVPERVRLTAAAVEAAGDVPVIAGIGAIGTRDVLTLTEAAQNAGAAAVLLAPVSYQPLTRAEVFGLYEDVDAALDIPLCIYDNPRTTGFTFDDELLTEIAALPHVASVKIPGLPGGPEVARRRVQALRAALPADITIGVSVDQFAADGLLAGCDAWYSAIAGVLPVTALALARAASSGDAAAAQAISLTMAPLWELFGEHGSARVVAAIAQELGLADTDFLPRPLRPIDAAARARARAALAVIERE